MSDLQSLHRTRAPQAPQTRIPETVRAATRSGGQSLDRDTQGTMSARFGHDFSHVRVHTDAQAVESAQALHAQAFTSGSDIVFGGGAFAPDTGDGQRLLAHELTHVVQQRAGGGNLDAVSRRGDASEQEAEQAAERVTSGESVTVSATPVAGVSRLGPDGYDPNPTLRLPDGPMGIGHKQDPGGEAGSYGYSNFDRFGPYGMPGFDFGAGVEASGEHKWDLGPGGSYGSVTGKGETGWDVKGNYGAWSDDKGANTRYGARVSGIGIPGGPPGGSGSIRYDDGHGRSLGLEGQAGTGSLEMSAGDDGATLGGGVTAIGGAVSANDGHEGVRAGLSAGPSLAGRLHWGQDQDGYRNYGLGADFGMFSLDFTTNDPLRTLARHGLDPTGGMIADALLPNGNVTDGAAGMFGLTTKNAGLGTTWDVAKGAASSAYNGAAGLASGAYNAGSSALSWGAGKLGEAGAGIGGALGDAAGWLGGKRGEARAGIRGAAGDAFNWGSGKAGEAAGGVSGAIGGALNWGGGKAGAIAGGVGGLINSASGWNSVGDAASGLGSAAGGALGWLGDTRAEARQGVRDAGGGALGWMGDTVGQAASGVTGAVGAATGWAGKAAGQAVSGVGSAVSDAAGWLGF